MTLTAQEPFQYQAFPYDYDEILPTAQEGQEAMELIAVQPTEPEAGKRADLTRVWAASSDIESLQWQLDRAHKELKDAVQMAFHNGVDVSEIAPSADLDPDEVQALLQS